MDVRCIELEKGSPVKYVGLGVERVFVEGAKQKEYVELFSPVLK